MTAKHKLNSFHFTTSLIFAGIIGGASGSWIVFGIVFAALLLAGFYTGDIRR